jgi:hypothetical protein
LCLLGLGAFKRNLAGLPQRILRWEFTPWTILFKTAPLPLQGIVSYIRSDLKHPPQLSYAIYSNPTADLRTYPINVLRNMGLGVRHAGRWRHLFP